MPSNKMYGRWAPWEVSVLSRVTDPQKCQQVVRQRQRAVDDDQDEAHLIATFFKEKIRWKGHQPETCAVFIPTTLLAEWIADLMGEKKAVTKVTSFLRKLGIPELRRPMRTSNCAGWIWRGANARSEATVVHI